MGLDWFDKLLDKIGFTNVVLLILILNQIGLLNKFKFWKKKDEADDMGDDAKQLRDTRFENLRDHYIELKNKVDEIMKSEAQEEVRFSVLENEQGHFKETVTDMKSDIGNIFKVLGEIKTLMIQGKNQ